MTKRRNRITNVAQYLDLALEHNLAAKIDKAATQYRAKKTTKSLDKLLEAWREAHGDLPAPSVPVPVVAVGDDAAHGPAACIRLPNTGVDRSLDVPAVCEATNDDNPNKDNEA